MDLLLNAWFEATSSHLVWSVLGRDGMERGAVFLLVALRLAGFFGVGLLLGQTLWTWHVRLGVVVLLTLIVAPGLNATDAGSDLILVGHQQSTPSESAESGSLPALDSPGIVPVAIGEVAIGATMGLGIALFLSGLKLAGEWLDRHSGLGLGSVLNPEYTSGGSAPAELVSLFCVTVILVMQPINGHLQVVRIVLDTFHAIPVGMGRVPDSLFNLLNGLLQQSLVLGLRIAMPFVVAMSLLDMTLGWIRRSSHWDLAPTAFAVRTAAALLILAATFPGIQEAVQSSLTDAVKVAHVDG